MGKHGGWARVSCSPCRSRHHRWLDRGPAPRDGPAGARAYLEHFEGNGAPGPCVGSPATVARWYCRRVDGGEVEITGAHAVGRRWRRSTKFAGPDASLAVVEPERPRARPSRPSTPRCGALRGGAPTPEAPEEPGGDMSRYYLPRVSRGPRARDPRGGTRGPGAVLLDQSPFHPGGGGQPRRPWARPPGTAGGRAG